jgi:hypothetical protein
MVDKLPALHLYVQDYLSDTRSLTNEVKGFYVDLLCYMHKSSRRGYYQQPNGNPYSLEQISAMTGCSTDEASRLLRFLIDSEVISATNSGIPFSRRMVRDEKKRLLCKKAGRLGGNPTLKGQVKGGAYPSSEDEDKDLNLDLNLDPNLNLRKGNAKGKPLTPVERKPNPLWDSLCYTFQLRPVTKSEKSRLGKAVREFGEKGATPDDIAIRSERYRTEWPNAAFTPEALFKHWDYMGQAKSRGINGSNTSKTQLEANMRRAMQEVANESHI